MKKYFIILIGIFLVSSVYSFFSGETAKQENAEVSEPSAVATFGIDVQEVTQLNQQINTEECQTDELADAELEVVMHSISLEQHDSIQNAIDLIAEKYCAVGLQVAVIEQGTVTDTYSYGWATQDIDPMTSEHKIRVASISKVFVGLAAMLLVEDGCVDLDRDISDYWGTTISNSMYPNNPITIRNMLNHTSSILCYGDDYGTNYSSMLSALQNGFTNTRPGDISGWCYNNYAFRVLGVTLELAANQTLDTILSQALFSKMDIDASFAAGDVCNTALLSTLYQGSGEVARSVTEQCALHLASEPGTDGLFFAGGLTISVADLAKVVALLANDGIYEGNTLLNAASVETMECYLSEPLEDGTYQALPLLYATGLYGRTGIYFHPGSAYGAYHCISYDPVTGDGVVVLSTGACGNVDASGVHVVCSEINEYIYGLLE